MRLLMPLYRSDVREQAAAEAVFSDELDDRELLASDGARGRRGPGPGFRLRGEGLDDGRVCDTLWRRTRHELQPIEIGPPFLGHAGRIGEVLLVLFFYKG